MELLDLLETRVDGLMTEMKQLRVENQRIAADAAEAEASLLALQEENQALKALLATERQLKDEVLERVDALLERLKDFDTDV